MGTAVSASSAFLAKFAAVAAQPYNDIITNQPDEPRTFLYF